MIFTPDEYVAMAEAAVALDHGLRKSPLIDLIGAITTLDDPYYMDLCPGTYQALLDRDPLADLSIFDGEWDVVDDTRLMEPRL